MASAEECREALQTLTGRLAEMNPKDRASYFGQRSMSCHVTDLGVTFVTRFTDQGAEPVTEAKPDDPPADIRLTGNSDDVISLAATRLTSPGCGSRAGSRSRPACGTCWRSASFCNGQASVAGRGLGPAYPDAGRARGIWGSHYRYVIEPWAT